MTALQARIDEPSESPAPPNLWRIPRHRSHAMSAEFSLAHADPRELNEEELKRLTKDDLVSIARNEALPNRSKMNKAQLARTLRRHFRRAAK
jgi:hypothetical protein